MVRQPDQYEWSSYAAYIGKVRPLRWLTTDWLLQYFWQKPAAAKQAYIFFVNAALGTDSEDPTKVATSTLILGNTKFIDDIREKYLGGKEKGRDIPALKQLTKTSLEGIIKASQKEFRGKPELARKAAIYLSHRYSGRSLREIGNMFGIGESAVSQAGSRFEAEMKESSSLRRRIELIKKAASL